MLPNGELILYELKQQWPVTRLGDPPLSGAFLPPLLWQPGMGVQPGALYLTQGPGPEGQGALVITCGSKPCTETGLWVQNADLWEVFNCLQQLYASLARWDAQLQAVVAQKGTLQQLLDVGSTYLGNLLVVSSAGLETISSSQQGRQRRRSDEKWDRPLNTADLMAMQEPMAIAREKAGVQWIRQPMWEYEFMYANLLEGRAKLGTLALLPVERPLEGRDACLLEHLLGYVQQRMVSLTGVGGEPLASLHRGLQMLLNGSVPPPEKLEYWQAAAGFERNDRYVCLVISLPAQIHAEYQGVLGRAILGQLPRAIVFSQERDLVLVVDEDQTSDPQGFYSWLESTLALADLKGGVSDSFTDLNRLPDYFREAKAALELGEEPLCRFSRCRENYILRHCVGQLPGELLYTPGFRRVLEHDRDSAVDYLETLRVWLEESSNESRAAARLHICRNTFLYRKKQLQTLLEGEADRAEGRFYLLLCLRLRDFLKNPRALQETL